MRGYVLSDNLAMALAMDPSRRVEEAGRLIRPLFMEMNDLVEYGRHQGTLNVPLNQAFYTIQDLVIHLIYKDGQLTEGEYAAYEEFCHACVFDSLKKEEIAPYYLRLDQKELLLDTALVKSMRDMVSDPGKYQSFLQGLWSLAVAERPLGEGEYRLVASFYDSEKDTLPLDYEEVKAQLKF